MGNMSKVEKIVTTVYRVVAILVLTVLAVAGALHLMNGVDPVIKYVFSTVVIAYAVREIL